jgi:hypothetical protein
LETMEMAALAGEPIDLQAYGTAADRLRRLLAEIGLERVARDVLTLAQYLDSKANQRPPLGHSEASEVAR